MSKKRDGLKINEMSRHKVSNETIVTKKRFDNSSLKEQETGKTVPNENCVKSMSCREKKMSRETGVKKKMPKDKDAKRKRRQRRAAEATSVSRDSGDIRKNLSGEKSVSSVWLQSCRQEGLSRFRHVRGKPDQETVPSSNKDVGNSETSKTKTSQRSGSRRPCQPGGQQLFL